MSSSEQTPQDRKDSASAQDCMDSTLDSGNLSSASAPSTQSLKATDADSSPDLPSSSRTDISPTIGSSSSPTSRVHDRNTSEISQEHMQSNFAPLNPVSHNLFPGANASSIMKVMPPMPLSALQPPVPSQASMLRPSFSYNVNPNLSKQFQPSPATNDMNPPKELSMPSAVHPSFQQSVPGRSLGLNSNLFASVKQNTSAVAQLASSTTLSFSGTSEMGTINSLEKDSPLKANTPVVTSSSSTSHSTPSASHFPIGSNPSIPSSHNVNPSAIQTPNVPSFLNSRPILQSPALAPQNLILGNVHQQNYPKFSSINPQNPLPQAVWLHSSHVGHPHHGPFGPYTGSLPALPIGMQNMPPFVPSPNLQPPGISGPIPSIGVQAAANELVQAAPLGSDARHVAEPSIKHEEADAWTSHRTETGVIYFYNSVTGKSTYEKPSCFTGEPRKADAQPTPVSWEKVVGTDWTLVSTNDGKKYYYNSKTKVSSWQIPREVLDQRKNQENEPLKESSNSVQNPSILKDNDSVQMGANDAVSSKPSALISPSALDLIKRKLQDSSSPVILSSTPALADLSVSGAVDASVKGQPSESNKEKRKDTNGDSNVSESSSESDDEDRGPSNEECIVQFKQMLKERGVAPFSKWEKELPKIIFDPRFKAVQSHSVRRSVFEHYVRTRAEEERKEKRAAQKALIDGFKQLLEEASEDINLKTDYQAFKRKWGDDPRFVVLGRKEREVLLNERISSLKKVVDEKNQALRTDFSSMLREKGTITSSSRWSRIKDSFRDDPRYRSVKREDREVFFNEYIAELKIAEAEAQLAAKAKIEEHDKLKRREEEMRKEKQSRELEMEAVRLRVRRKEAESSYQALLVEKIKDPKASWTESKPKLEKDPQGRAKNPDLSLLDMEKLFREHVKNLYERCARDYRALLSEVLTMEVAEKAATLAAEGEKTILTSWSEAKSILRSDPRYSKMPGKEREILWSRFTDDLRRKLLPKSGCFVKEKAEAEESSKKRTVAVANDLPAGSSRSPKRRHRHRSP